MHGYLTLPFQPHIQGPGSNSVSTRLERAGHGFPALDRDWVSEDDPVLGLPNGSELSLRGLLEAVLGTSCILCCVPQWTRHRARGVMVNDWRSVAFRGGFAAGAVRLDESTASLPKSRQQIVVVGEGITHVVAGGDLRPFDTQMRLL
jgi:hypothetical protein